MKREMTNRDKSVLNMVFTDLDGTLLDHETYEWEKAKPGLDLCRGLGIPVIMVSSKTSAELAVLSHKIKLPFPFISENGGGVFFPKEPFFRPPNGTVLANNFWKWSLGTPYDCLVKILHEIRLELDLRLKGFSEMSLEEISEHTGLDLSGSRLASMREFDEPFLIHNQKDVDIGILIASAEKRGQKISKGGRFYHLHGENDKGSAVRRLISWYEEYNNEVFTIALGDSPNDFAMLRQVDQPVLIRSRQDFPGIEEEIPGIMISKETGPEGWSLSIKDILTRIVR